MYNILKQKAHLKYNRDALYMFVHFLFSSYLITGRLGFGEEERQCPHKLN